MSFLKATTILYFEGSAWISEIKKNEKAGEYPGKGKHKILAELGNFQC